MKTKRLIPTILQAITSLALFGFVTAASADATELPSKFTDLPKISADMAQVTVSGLSAGAFMASQLHYANPRALGRRPGYRAI